MVSRKDRIYLAGIIDGEGYVSILKKKREGKYQRVPYYADAVVKVASVDKILIDFIHDRYPGYVSKRIPKKKNHKISWAWDLKGTMKVKHFLEDIYPYMLVKQKNAKIVLDFIRLRERMGRVGIHRGNKPTTQSDWDEMENYIIEVRKLTARGHNSHRNNTRND